MAALKRGRIHSEKAFSPIHVHGTRDSKIGTLETFLTRHSHDIFDKGGGEIRQQGRRADHTELKKWRARGTFRRRIILSRSKEFVSHERKNVCVRRVMGSPSLSSSVQHKTKFHEFL